MSGNLYELPAWRIAQGVISGDFTARTVASDCIDRMKALEPALKACLLMTEEKAYSQAQRVDEKIAKGEEPGLLAGVPIALKDIVCTKGIDTTCGSKMLEGWRPPYDAAIVKYLERNGAVIIAKTNMDEFAMGSSTEHSAYFPTRNPHDTTRTPGGSSGGSAAAVSAGYAPLGIGTDTGGSIRQPAAFCGIHGLKPSYGMVSRYGIVAYASSLDQAGPMSRDMGDLALAMDVLSAPDARDATNYCGDRHRFLSSMRVNDLKGRKIGVLTGYDESAVEEPLRKALKKAAQICADAGATLREISLPVSMKYGIAAYYIIAPAEASSNLARYDGVRYGYSNKSDNLEDLFLNTRSAFGDEVKRRILTGTYVLSSGYYDAFYVKGQQARALIAQEFSRVFEGVDAILTPTSPTRAFKLGEHEADPAKMYLGDMFTIPVNLAGLPGLSVYAGMTDGLPDAVQVIGPKYADHRILRIGVILERAFGAPSVVNI